MAGGTIKSIHKQERFMMYLFLTCIELVPVAVFANPKTMLIETNLYKKVKYC